MKFGVKLEICFLHLYWGIDFLGQTPRLYTVHHSSSTGGLDASMMNKLETSRGTIKGRKKPTFKGKTFTSSRADILRKTLDADGHASGPIRGKATARVAD